MLNKEKLLITLLFGLIITSVFQNPCSAFDYRKSKAMIGAQTAGVSGLAGEINNYSSCKSDKCKDLLKQVTELDDVITQDNNKITGMLNEITDPKYIKIKTKLEDDLNKLDKELKKGEKSDKRTIQDLQCKISRELEDVMELSVVIKPEIKELRKILEPKITKYDTLMNELSQASATYNIEEFKKNKRNKSSVEKKDNNTEGTSEKKNDSSGNNDVTDVKFRSYLKNGDLVAWGIPGIPSIPVSKPSHKEKNVTENQASDATYQALRSVEQEGDKVTQSEVDQFLQQLNSQTAQN